MTIKEKIFGFITLESKKTEISVSIISLIIQSISIIVIIQFSNLIQNTIFWILIILIVFLSLVFIFQFISSEMIIESLGLTLQFKPEYDGSIEELFSTLNIPSVNTGTNSIKFEKLNFSIRNNSKSLAMQTGGIPEKVVSQMYNNLQIFREKFEEEAKRTVDINLNTLRLYCKIDLKIKGVKIMKKNDALNKTKTFEDGLIIEKTREKIIIIIPENCKLKIWKELKKLMLS